jgi:FtsP/CotA-like multicopper oxidase with cupredoxin domain
MNSPANIPNLIRSLMGRVSDPYSRDARGLPEAKQTQVVELQDGNLFELRSAPVRKRIGKDVVKMLAFNGSIPGPTLKVRQGSQLTVHFSNDLELDTTVHWHGLRLEHRYDGVPQGEHHGMQAPIRPGASFTYVLSFPDPGVFWYHPHIREDYTQEHGLYGNIIVVPSQPDYWAPANREVILVLDDILIQGGKVAQFSQSSSNLTAMGRFGNVLLANGETDWHLEAQKGEVVRFYLSNTANVRIFNFSIEGARLKLVGSDNGRVEREQLVETVLLSPSERFIVDVLFDQPGSFPLVHRTPEKTYALGTVEVGNTAALDSFVQEFNTLRSNPELEAERANLAAEPSRPPDKTLKLVGEMPGMKHGGHMHMEPIEWEDTMNVHNRLTNPQNMHWKLVDAGSGTANHDIRWAFKTGERVKIRIDNVPDSDHPMHHPIHFHGQRFLVLSQDGVPNDNLSWKDTTLVRAGEKVDILLDCSNPGLWMAHCHIAEHVEGGMMLNFLVTQEGAGKTEGMEHHHHS